MLIRSSKRYITVQIGQLLLIGVYLNRVFNQSINQSIYIAP